MPAAINTTATIAEWCADFGLRGRAESASVTGTRETARPGHQAAALAARTATRPIIAKSAQGRLSRSRRKSSAGSSVGSTVTQSARPATVPISAERSDDCAVREQHESKVLLGRADCREHAELAEPSLRDDGEARCGNERSQQHEDGGHGEHRQLGCRLVAAPKPGPDQSRPVALLLHERADRLLVGVDQDRDGVRCPGGRG